MDRHRLALEQHDVEALRVVDQPEAALRRDQLGDVGDMLLGLRGREDEGGRADAERGDLRRQRLAHDR